MKGKITIVLFSLVLAFGMLAASCDNGDLPKRDEKDALTLVAYEDAGKNLPLKVADFNEAKAPKPITGKALWKKLYGPSERSEYPVNSGKFVQNYLLITVGSPPTGESSFTTDELKIAQKYAGLPLVIRNPVVPPLPVTP